MFGSLALPWLLLIFAASAGAIWRAGISLSDSTDVLSTRLGLGEALGGLLLLAMATNLPEIAITVTAALRHNLGIAVGNILGGIAIQTVVLVVLDGIGIRRPPPLTFRAASLVLVIEGALVLALLAVVVSGSQLPSSLTRGRVDPASVLIIVLWGVGVWLIGRARHGLPWHEAGEAPESQQAPGGHAKKQKDAEAQKRGASTAHVALVFGIAAIVTLVAGVILEQNGERLAGKVGMSGVIFGATILAGATALPEVSTGLASVKLGDYKLAVSDIFGGNAFLPVLFFPATILSGSAVLPQAHASDIFLTALGALLTLVYVVGLLFRPRRRVLGVGLDSLVVLVLYAIGIAGLIAVNSR